MRKNVEIYGNYNVGLGRNKASISVATGVGLAFPNAADRREDRGEAKIVNCSALFRGMYKGWPQMNTHNAEVMLRKLSHRGHGIRNVTASYNPDEWLKLSTADKLEEVRAAVHAGLGGMILEL